MTCVIILNSNLRYRELFTYSLYRFISLWWKYGKSNDRYIIMWYNYNQIIRIGRSINVKNHVNCLRRILLSVRYIRPREGEYAHGHNFHYTPCQSTGKTIYIFNYYLWTERLWKFLWLCGIHGGVVKNAVKDVCIAIYIKAMQNVVLIQTTL